MDKTGYGAGNKQFATWPNVVRVWLGEETTGVNDDGLVLLETNIDDMNPQIYGYLMERLFTEKAADVWFTPIQMKKNRPAIMLSVLAPCPLETKLTEIIMRETSTLGIRSRPVSRHMAQREIIEFDSSLGRPRPKSSGSGRTLSRYLRNTTIAAGWRWNTIYPCTRLSSALLKAKPAVTWLNTNNNKNCVIKPVLTEVFFVMYNCNWVQ